MFVFILNFNFRYFFNFKVHGSSLQSVFEEYLVPVTTFAQLENNFCVVIRLPPQVPLFQTIISFFLFFFVLSHHLLHTYPFYKIVSYIDLSRTSKLWTVYNLCSTLNSGIYILPTSSIGFEFNKIYFGLGKQVGRLLYYEM